MIILPRILDQGYLGACQSYAVANLVSALLLGIGINDEIDPITLFNANERNGAASLFKVLEYGRVQGLPSINGLRYRILAQPISTRISSIQQALNQYKGLILGFSTHSSPFQNRLENYELKRPDDSHAVIIVEDQPSKYRLKIANSWGVGFGEQGYFYIGYSYFGSGDIQNVVGISLI